MGDGVEQGEEEEGGKDSDAELEAPLDGSGVERGDDGVGEIGEEDSDDDVDLEESDESPAPPGGGELGDVDGAEDGGAADPESSDEAEEEEA